MAELIAGFLGPAIEVVRWVGAPIMRQFNYLCCFTNNIANLKLEVEELQNAAGDLQEQVERARENVQVIAREVEAWLVKSNDIKDKSNGILNDATNLESGCLKLRALFSLSKRAKKTTDGIKDLRGRCNFDVISHPGPPPAQTTTPLGVNTYEFESRKQIEEDTMTSLRQLRQCNPDIPEIIANVYNPLRLSYDVLGSKHKSVFLLCCLFGEDVDISLEYLTYFCMGLGIFEKGRDFEEARNRMCSLTKMLKSRSLLLDSKREGHVRMHDVVRDVCIFIAKRERYIGENDYTCISSSSSSFQLVGERANGRLDFPNLRLLFLICNSTKEEFKCTYLEGIRDLYVLFIEGNYSLTTSLPRTTQSLKNLNTLFLHSCRGLETISVVGELVKLEILICRYCVSIKELPVEIKGLNRLKLLELSDCHCLQRIGRGIISNLVGLEELKMNNSFTKWEAWDIQERENAAMRELEALINLRFLEIQIDDPALVAENMQLSSKLERFRIRTPAYPVISGFFSYSSNKKMSLRLEGETVLGDWIEMQLLRDTEYLSLSGNGANNVDFGKSENIRWLDLGECETMKNFVNVFPSIEYMCLYSLPELEEIWNCPISSDSFQNLKELSLRKLPTLKQLWKSSSPHNQVPLLSVPGKDFPFSQLETLKIRDCEMLEQVFLWNDEDEGRITKIMFSKLKVVELNNLPNLVTLCQGIGAVEFPLLNTMTIIKCPKMNVIESNQNDSGGSSNYADIDDNHSSHLFCQPQKVSFGNLEEFVTGWNPFCGHKIDVSLFIRLEKLRIFGNPDFGSKSLFLSSIAKNLVNLVELRICSCDEMVRVIIDEEEKTVSCGQRNLLFPKLQELELYNLPKLVSFCKWKCDVELPSLRQLGIQECPNMKNLTLDAPNLEDFTTDLNNQDGVKVPFENLKQLTIQGNENPLYCYKLPVSLFNGVEELTISCYKGSMSSFSSSIAGNLVSLRVLNIWHCDEMVKVIEDEEEEEAVSGDERILVFPKLQELWLRHLRKLESFCKCDVELPSLMEVRIEKCPNMKIFTLGSLVTPNLIFYVWTTVLHILKA